MEKGSVLTGFRLAEPLFTFGRGKSASTSAIMSEGPADRNNELGYKRAVEEVVPWVFSDGELDKPKRLFYEDLFQGSDRFYGLANVMGVKVPSLNEVTKTNLLGYRDPKKLDELVSHTEGKNIALGLLYDERWRSTLKATCDYRGLSSQIVSKVLRKAEPKKGDQIAIRQHQNILKNLVIEIYAKCGGVPWVLARQLGRKYFIGMAWMTLREYYFFALVPFDSKGFPLYDKAVLRPFQRSTRDFRSCTEAIIEEGLSRIDLGNSKLTLHFHGDLFGLEDTFTRVLNEHCKEWVVLSVERPKYPFFRLFSQSTKDGVNEKGICVPMDGKRFVVSTTGLPHFTVKGTPQNLFCESMREINPDEMLEEATDIYHLAQLNWAYIRGHDQLPVTTKLTSNIATGLRDAHAERQKIGLWTSQTSEAKPWSFW